MTSLEANITSNTIQDVNNLKIVNSVDALFDIYYKLFSDMASPQWFHGFWV